MDDIIYRLVKLPNKINAVTVIDENGDYNVYINENLTYEEQLKSYKHEKKHIKKNHFYQDKAIDKCEKEANE